FRRDGVELLRAFGRGGDVAGFFQIGQRRIDDAGARRVPVRRLLFQELDDLVAVARCLGDEGQRDQAQVALHQHAARPHQVFAAFAKAAAVAAAKAEAAEPALMPACCPALFAGFVVSVSVMSVHFQCSPCQDISLDSSNDDVAQDISFDISQENLDGIAACIYSYTNSRHRIQPMARSHPSNPLALAVLALLFERPMHPYEMGVILKQRHKEDSIKLRYGSLYTVIELLLTRGF